MSDSLKTLQDQIIAKAKRTLSGRPLPQKIIEAFYAVPRHEFVPRFRKSNDETWTLITPNNLAHYLATIYADSPLVIYGSEKDFDSHGAKAVSTISQPSFVLGMLDLLRLESGHKVFELGAGSGWNAALIGYVVGPAGHVTSVEIIPELIEPARASLKRVGIDNVSIVLGDGGEGHAVQGPYDRGIFTAGSTDLPRAFFEQIKNRGLLLFVLKNHIGTDTLMLLEKREDHFASLFTSPCGFVPMTGKFGRSDLSARTLPEILVANAIENKEVAQDSFWWDGTSEEKFVWSNSGLRSFLAISEPRLVAVDLGNGQTSFGLLDKATHSFALAKHNCLISYGTTQARDELLRAIKGWIDAGMPGTSNLKLKIYPSDHPLASEKGAWIDKRQQSTFVWHLPARS